MALGGRVGGRRAGGEPEWGQRKLDAYAETHGTQADEVSGGVSNVESV